MELYPGWTLNRFLIFNHTAQFDLNKIYTKTASKFKWAHGPYRDTQYKPFPSLFGNTSGHSVFKLKSNIFILKMTKVLTFLQKTPLVWFPMWRWYTATRKAFRLTHCASRRASHFKVIFTPDTMALPTCQFLSQFLNGWFVKPCSPQHSKDLLRSELARYLSCQFALCSQTSWRGK